MPRRSDGLGRAREAVEMRKITVTARDIENGSRSDSGRCPIARAIKRVYRHRSVQVDEVYAFWYVRGLKHIIKLPQKVQRFIARFDAGELVKPIKFVVKE
jgi:hypothetical protein